MNSESQVQSDNANEWIPLAEAAEFTPYSADYLSLLARRRRLTAKKIDGIWYTTRAILTNYLAQQAKRAEVLNQNPDSYRSFITGPEYSREKNAQAARSKESDGRSVDTPSNSTDVVMEEGPRGSNMVGVTSRDDVGGDALMEEFMKRFNAHIDRQVDSQHGWLFKLTRFVRNSYRHTVWSAKFPLFVISLVIIVVLPLRFVSGFADNFFQNTMDAVKNAQTVMGFRPGTHENEILLLGPEGEIAIFGNVETEGQFRSYVEDGIAPITVKSTTKIDNLNADMLDGASAHEFTLAYVTKNGNITYEPVFLEGTVEVGQTLLVKGATKLLNSLRVDGDLSVFGAANFAEGISVTGPAVFKDLLTAPTVIVSDLLRAHSLVVEHDLDVEGAITATSGRISGNFYVEDTFGAHGNVSLGADEYTVKITSEEWSVDEDGDAVFQDLMARGDTSLAALTVGGNADFSGSVSIDGALNDASGSAGTLGYILQSTGTSTQWVATSSLGIVGSGGGISSINGQTGTSQTFATSTATGIGLTITSSGDVHTFTPTVSAGYTIPLTASTTQWSDFYNTPSTRITAGDNLAWSGNTLVGTFGTSSARASISETVTGLDYDSGTGVLSLTSGYIIPLTASTTEWATAYASSTTLTPSYIRNLFSNTATGLTYNSSTGATSLTSGYVIPLSASTTEWTNFYNTPSTRITAGNGLAWTGNSLGIDGPVSVGNGGTGATSLTGILLGNGTSPFTATTSLSSSYIEDAYVRNTGDTMTGNLVMGGTAANIALGSNWLSGDGDDEGIFVGALGHVGIGTSSPAFRLDIVQSSNDYGIRTSDGTTEAVVGISSTNTGLFGTRSDHDAQFITNNTIRVTIDNAGNVGIGDTSPASLLSVGAGDAFQVSATGTVTSGTWNGSDIDISEFTNLSVGNGVTLTDDVLTVTAAGGLAQTVGGLTTTGVLEDLNTLGAPSADGEFIVATGAGAFAYESGATVRTSLGLGTMATQNANNVAITGGTAEFSAATSTDLVVTGDITTSLSDGCVEVAGGVLTSLGLSCGTSSGGVTSLNGLTASSQSFATSTSGGLNLTITSSGSVHTFTAGLVSGYTIPLTASTTQWSDFYNTPSTRITAGDNLAWSGNTLVGTFGTSSARASISETVTGLDYTSATGVLSLTSGYVIPLSASTTEWSDFYNTPSNRITAGDGLSWSTNTLNLDINELTEESGFTTGDYLAFYDATAGAIRKVNFDDLPGAGGGLTSLNGLSVASQTFATSTSGGLTLTITSTSSIHTFTPGVASGYTVPLTASTTEWSDFYNTPSTRITAGDGLSWSTNTLNLDINELTTETTFETGDFLAFYDATAGAVRKLSYDNLPGAGGSLTTLNGLTAASQTFATSSDTNIGINVVSSGSTHTFTPTWTGTLAVSRGGTGAATLTGLVVGNGTSAMTATTTSAGLSGVISDETGSGALVFGTSPTFTTNATFFGDTISDFTGVGLTLSSGALTVSTSTLGLNTTFFEQGGNSFGTTATLGTNDSNNLAFETGGTTRVTVTSAGLVGIGTTTPSNLFHAYGAFATPGLLERSTGSNVGLQFKNTEGSFYTGLDSSEGYSISTGADLLTTALLRVTSTGNVGIGTTTPGSLLTIAGTAEVTGAATLRSTLNVIGNTTLANASTTNFSASGTANISGATALGSTLNVTGNTTLANASTTNLTVSTNSYLGTVRSGTWNGSTIGETYGGTGQTTYATGDILYASGANTLAKRTIGSTGDILLVSGGVPTWTATSSLGLAASFFQQNGNSFGTTATLGTNDANTLAFETSGTARMTILSSGNVGVGDDTPASLFTVGAGDAFQVNSSGTVLAGTWNGSDVDISDYTNLSVSNGITLTGDVLSVTAAGGLAQTTGGLTTTGVLEDLNTLGAPSADGEFIVATGAGTFAYESGATVRTSLGLVAGGDGDIWVEKAGDTMTGGLTMGGTAANIALGSNYLSGDGGDEGIYVDSSGNVAIGTSSPLAEFHVSSSGVGQVIADTNVASDAQYELRRLGVLKWFMRNDFAGTMGTDGLIIQDAAGNEKIGIEQAGDIYLNGNVGVGTSTIGARLHVLSTTEQLRLAYDGSNYWTDTVASNGDRTIAGVGTGGSLNIDLYGGATGDFSVNSDDFYVDTSTSNVGIGDTAPSQLLDITGTNPQVLTEESTTEFLRTGVGETAGTSVVGWDDADALHLGLYSSPTDTTIDSLMTILSSGNVGIGVTAPSEIFHVYKSGGNANLATFQNPDTSTTGAADIELIASSTTAIFKVYNSAYSGGSGVLADSVYLGQFSGTGGLLLGTETAAPIRFATNGYASERMRITSSGNVGIGTTTPASLLHLDQTFTATGLSEMARFVHRRSDIEDTDEGSYLSFKIIDGNNAGETYDHARISWRNNGTGLDENEGELGFWTATNGSVTEKMTIDSSGNVGIGDATPSALFTVGSGDLFQINSSGYALAPAGAASTPAFSFVADTNTGIYNPSADVIGFSSQGTQLLQMRYWDSTSNSDLASLHVGVSDAGALLQSAANANFTIGLRENGSDDAFEIVSGGGNWSSDSTYDTTILTARASGNVGIGTSTPSHLFTVAGDTNQTGALRFAGNAGTTGQVLVSNGSSAPAWTATSSLGLAAGFFAQGGNSFGTTATLGTNDSNNLAFETGGTTRVTIDTSGNVGIGDSTPTALLSVGSADLFQVNNSGHATSTGLTITRYGSPTFPNNLAADSETFYSYVDDSTVHFFSEQDENSGASGNFAFIMDDDGTATPYFRVGNKGGGTFEELFRIDSDGDVGVGTASPLARLSILDDSTAGSGTTYMVDISGDQSVANTGTYMGIQTDPTYSASSGATLAALTGIQSNPRNTSSGIITNMRGVYSIPQNTSTGTTSSMFGVTAQPQNTSTGAVTSMYGVYASPGNTSSGNVTAMYGFLAQPRQSGAGGTVTTMYGAYLDCGASGASGTVTTCYGLRVGAPALTGTVGNVYAIWVDDNDIVLDQDGTGTLGGTTGSTLFIGEGQDLELYHDGTNSYIMNNTGDLYIGDAATDDVILSANGGRVGIGTSSPSTTLNVYGASGNAVRVDVGATVQTMNNTAALAAVVQSGYGNAISGQAGGTTAWAGIFENTVSGALAQFAGGSSNPYAATFTGGNVGIGTTTPAATLTISGGTATDTAGSGQILQLATSAGTPLFGFRMDSGNTHLILDKSWGGWSSTPAFAINRNTGNFGIGTTTPGAKLQVLSTTEQLRLAYSSSVYWTDTIASDGGRTMTGFGTDGDLDIVFTGATDGDFSINSDDLFVDTSSGNIGINDATPEARLKVISNSADNVPALKVDGGGDASTEYVGYLLGRSASFPSTVLRLASNRVSSSGYNFIEAVIDEDGTPATAFLVRGDGYVGVGTTTPVWNLTVENTSGAPSLGVNRSAGKFANLYAGTAYTGINFDSTGYFAIGPSTSYSGTTNTSFVINGAGLVGIGTNAPVSELTVSTSTAGEVNTTITIVGGSSSDWGAEDPLGELSFYTSDTSGIGAHSVGGIGMVHNGGHTLTVGSEMVFYTAGTNAARGERMRIDSSGNVGIGNTDPDNLLSVGSADYFQVTSGGAIYQDHSNATYDVWIQGSATSTSGDARNLALLGNATTDDLLLNYNSEYDCVSVGGTSCTEMLTVTGSVDASVQFLGQASDTVSAPSFSWTGDTNVGMYRPTTDTIGFTTAGAEAMRIISTGHVGIGITSPYALLEIASTSAGTLTDALTVRNTSITQNTETGIFFAPSSSFNNARGARISAINADGSNTIDLKFYTGVGATITEKLRITGGGNIGIGTSSPSSLLHVEGSSATPLTIYRNSTSNVSMEFRNQTRSWYVGQGSGGNFNIDDDNDLGSSPLFTLTTAGSAGIGTTTPSAAFAITGVAGSTDIFAVASSTNARFLTVNAAGNLGVKDSTPTEGTLTVGGTLYVLTNNDVGAAQVCWDGSGGSLYGNCSSLAKWKTNIESFEAGLEEILALEAVHFDWKRNADGSLTTDNKPAKLDADTGFIADQVASVNYHFGRYDAGTGELRGVNDRAIMGAMVNAIKETHLSLRELLTTGTTTASSTFAFLNDPESGSVWSKMVALANSFVDGVLTLASAEIEYVKADKIETKELCVGNVCVDEGTFLKMVKMSGGAAYALEQDPPSSGGGGAGDEGTVEETSSATSTDPIADSDEPAASDETPEENGGTETGGGDNAADEVIEEPAAADEEPAAEPTPEPTPEPAA